MRPLSLRLEGFTCYKQATEVNFEGLDLFAITGPTGSGKSSIVDGITYALYGRVPRLGNEVRSLISLGAERLQAAFEFAVNGDPSHPGGKRYRVVRSTGRKGAGHVQLFAYDEGTGEWEGLADRSAAVAQQVRNILGLDYEGFIRSVLLPQGQFHLFLAGEPKQRYEVLEDLLRLDIYARIMQAANARAREAEGEADALARRLAEDYADATPEALKARQRELKELEARRAGLDAIRAALVEARQVAEAMRSARAAQEEALRRLNAARSALETAEATLRDGKSRLEELDKRITTVDAEIKAIGYDPEAHQRLKLALTPARELEKASARAEALVKRRAQAEKAAADAAKLVEERKRELDEAAAGLEEARAALEELRRHRAAVYLRESLSAGEACPVCGQSVATLPPKESVSSAEMEDARRKQEAAAETQKRATAALSQAQQTQARAEAELSSVVSEAEKTQEEIERWHAELVERLGADLPAGRQGPVAVARIQERTRELEAARAHSEELRKERDGLQKERDGFHRKFLAAEAEASARKREAALHQETADGQREEAEARSKELAELAGRHGWPDVSAAIEQGRDATQAVSLRQSEVESQATALNQDIGAATQDISRIEKGIAHAKQLRSEEKQLRKSAETAKQLASLLRADRFQAYIQRAALEVLAVDASKHLRMISDNRYELELEELPESGSSTFRRESQEFVVVDHWGDQERRSVKTLSGGETFLASLALALALAERLPELGAAVRPTRLDSLFLDEGFGTLDDDSLRDVADALDRLHLGADGERPSGRTVGVITHRQELAERMPAQIRVIKSQDGSRIEQI